MADRGRTIYIAGAGIAGLTLALALAKFGATVVVLEKRDSVQEFGAGLQISPNARRVLDGLGLSEAISAVSLEPEGIDVFPYRAPHPAITLQLGAPIRERFGTPYAVMHRADLVETLHKACKRFANIEIVFGVRSFDLVTHTRGLTVATEEPKGRSRTARPFALVGADGVHSRTRNTILGGREAKYSGYAGWRALIDIDALDGVLATDRTSLLLGPGYHTVVYPLPRRGNANIALFAQEPEKRAFARTPPRGPTFPRNAPPGPQLAQLLDKAGDTWTHWPLSMVQTPHWHNGPVGLVGDAAHAMLPFQAQGAAMAIEDAAVLAPLLVTEKSADAAFARFESLRRRRVERVARISATNGRIFHLGWPMTAGRDTVMRLQGPTAHFRRLDWIYGYDAVPEVERDAARRGA